MTHEEIGVIIKVLAVLAICWILMPDKNEEKWEQ
mgnify:CR=1 FL=1